MRTNWQSVILGSLIACLHLCGCQQLWDSANRVPFQADASNILKKAGVEPQITMAHMVGTSRAAVAEFSISEADFKKLISTLQLEKVSRIPPDFTAKDSPLLDSYLHGSDNVEAYSTTEERPSTLKLEGGSAFEYAVFLYNSRSGKACLLTCYAYG